MTLDNGILSAVTSAVSERVLVTGAGGAGSNNVIRSLRAADVSLEIFGCHDDRFLLKKSLADRAYLIPPLADRRGQRALRQLVDAEGIRLVIPTSEPDVAVLSRLRASLGERIFLPRRSAIDLCQDKFQLNAFLRARGIPAPATVCVSRLPDLRRAFRKVATESRAWCRIRDGAGSLGAIAVDSADQARDWIGYWREMRGVAPSAFILSEYLPGRDFGCQSVWKNGVLVLIKTYERLSYLVAGSQPTEVSSVAALAKTVFEPRVVETCTTAIRAIDPRASGVFSVDLRESARGIPCITEINAGRFSSATPIFDLTGKYNTAVTYVRLALGMPVEAREVYDVVDDHYMLRDLDTPPTVFHADDFFDGVHEVLPFTDNRKGRTRDGQLSSRGQQGSSQAQSRAAAERHEPGGQGAGPEARARDQGPVSQVQAHGRGRQEARAGSEVEKQETAVTIPAHLDAQAAEAFWLELRRLARRYGADVEERAAEAPEIRRARRAPARTSSPSHGRV